jgi:ankyrin repeat protein
MVFDCDSPNPDEWNAFVDVIESGDVTEVERLLDEHPAWLHYRDPHLSWRPIDVAVRNDHIELVERLIHRGAEVDAHDQWGRTPLHWAGEGLALAAAIVLVDHGANVRTKDAGGGTPLIEAAGRYGPEAGPFVDFLLERGASLDLYTALALERGEEARRILSEDPDAVAKTVLPEVLLRQVIGLISLKTIPLTIAESRSRRALDASGKGVDYATAVRAAVLEEMDLIDTLIARGALQYPSYDALYDAFELPDPMVAERLLEAGAERVARPGSPDRFGLFYAVRNSVCKEHMCSLLVRYGVPKDEGRPLC